MTTADRLLWLQAEIDKLVERYHDECTRFKREAFQLRIVSVILAALITVLLGLKFRNDALTAWFSNIALVLGAAISVLSAYEAFFDPRALWVRETVTFARLKDLQRDVRFWTSGVDPGAVRPEMLEMFKRRLDAILEDTLKYWMKIRGAPDLEKGLAAKAELRSKEDSAAM